jgi:hypothetical protein
MTRAVEVDQEQSGTNEAIGGVARDGGRTHPTEPRPVRQPCPTTLAADQLKRWQDLDLGGRLLPLHGQGRQGAAAGAAPAGAPGHPGLRRSRRSGAEAGAGGLPPATVATSRWTASTSGTSCARPPRWPGFPWGGRCPPCATPTPALCAGWEEPLKAVQAALDHSNLATTSIYLRQLEGQEDPWWPKLPMGLGLQGKGGSGLVSSYGEMGHLDQSQPAP